MAIDPLTAGNCTQAGINCPGPNTGAAIASFIFKLAAPLLTLAAVVCVAALVYGGAMYIMSTGDESQAHKAKLVIIYAVLGLVIIGLAGIAVNAIIGNPAAAPSPSISPLSS